MLASGAAEVVGVAVEIAAFSVVTDRLKKVYFEIFLVGEWIAAISDDGGCQKGSNWEEDSFHLECSVF